jgi:hypothetical protein
MARREHAMRRASTHAAAGTRRAGEEAIRRAEPGARRRAWAAPAPEVRP